METNNITYTHHIHSMEIIPNLDDLENVIVRVKWEIIARCGIHVCSELIVTELNDVQNKENFISFEDLTEAMVFEWVYEIVNLEKIQQRLIDELDGKINNPVIEVMPAWGQSADWLNRKYVLVHNNEILWGPAPWKVDDINSALKTANVNIIVDRSWLSIPQTPAVEIGEHTWLYQANVNSENLSDRLFEMYDEIEWSFSEQHGAIGTQNKIYKPLEAIKNDINQHLTMSANENLVNVDIVIDDNTITVDYQDIVLYSCIANFGDDNEEINVSDTNNQTHAVPRYKLRKALSDAAVILLESINQTELKTQIHNATSVEELKQIWEEHK